MWDRFKSVNDEHGHVQGDDVLRQVANALSANVRPYDLVGRWGGEEFLLLLPGTSQEQARQGGGASPRGSLALTV